MTEKTEPIESTQNTPEKNAAGGGESNQPEKRSYSQTELDAMFGERAKSAKQAAINDLMAELGVDSPDAIKAALAEAEKARKAQMSELEQAQADAQAAKAAKEKAEAERDAALKLADEKLMKAAVITAAQNFNDPEDAWRFIDKTKITKGEDDKFAGIDDALKAVIEAKPYLVKSEVKPSPVGSPTIKRGIGQQWQQQQPNQQTPENTRPLVNL